VAAAKTLRVVEARLLEGLLQRLPEAVHVVRVAKLGMAEDVLLLSGEGAAATVLPELLGNRLAERDRPLPRLGLRVFDPQSILDQVEGVRSGVQPRLAHADAQAMADAFCARQTPHSRPIFLKA
jgi:hypothetical protein